MGWLQDKNCKKIIKETGENKKPLFIGCGISVVEECIEKNTKC